jgi:hypothetical protein
MLKKANPHEGGATRIHWAYRATARGESWHGYLWGEVFGIIAHRARRTLPCLRWMTDGALPCESCERMTETYWRGYVPIVRESDGRPCLVVIGPAAMQFVERCKYRDRVIVSRGRDATDSVTVQRAPVQRAWHTSLDGLKRPAELAETLLRLWAIPPLTEWARGRGAAGATASADGPMPAVGGAPAGRTGAVDAASPADGPMPAVGGAPAGRTAAVDAASSADGPMPAADAMRSLLARLREQRVHNGSDRGHHRQ